MPLPAGLVDIRVRHATPEQRRAMNAAVQERRWGEVNQFRDAVEFVFENGAVARLPVSLGGLDLFLRQIRSIEAESRREPEIRPEDMRAHMIWPDDRDRPPVAPSPPVALTVWARLMGGE